MLQFDENWSSYNQFIAYREEIKRRDLRLVKRWPAAFKRQCRDCQATAKKAYMRKFLPR